MRDPHKSSVVHDRSRCKFNPLDIAEIALEAGKAIMEVYNSEFEVDYKDDESPLTEADLRSNKIIFDRLSNLESRLPVLSEEISKAPFSERKSWEELWVVDPLDGTKEFVNRTDEFTVNIALVRSGKPVLGVVYAPALKNLYYASANEGAFKCSVGEGFVLENAKRVFADRNQKNKNRLTIVGSRSHHSPEMSEFLEKMQAEYPEVNFVKAGSALKFCLVAEGTADIYPRLAPTWEWDTAAAHSIASEAGLRVQEYQRENELEYNKENLLNPWFICS